MQIINMKVPGCPCHLTQHSTIVSIQWQTTSKYWPEKLRFCYSATLYDFMLWFSFLSVSVYVAAKPCQWRYISWYIKAFVFIKFTPAERSSYLRPKTSTTKGEKIQENENRLACYSASSLPGRNMCSTSLQELWLYSWRYKDHLRQTVPKKSDPEGPSLRTVSNILTFIGCHFFTS